MRTAGLFGALLWWRLGLAAVLIGVPLLVGLVLVWWTTRTGAAGQARRARLIGLGVGALVGVVTVFAALGFLAPVAIVAGYLVGVHYGEPAPVSASTGTRRVAWLPPRTVRRYVPRWALLVAIGAAALTVLAPAILAPIPAASYGPWHPVADDPGLVLPGDTLHWPSAVHWIPLGVVAAGALVIGALLIQRFLPLSADPSGLRESDYRARVRTITAAVTGIELVTLGALVLFVSAGVGVPVEVGGVAYVVSRILVWTGLGLAAAGIVVWWVLSTGRRGDPIVPDTQPQA